MWLFVFRVVFREYGFREYGFREYGFREYGFREFDLSASRSDLYRRFASEKVLHRWRFGSATSEFEVALRWTWVDQKSFEV